AMSEFLFGFFVVLSIYLLYIYSQRRNLLLVPLIGIVWGLGTLTRSPLLYCIIIIPLWLILQDKTQWKRHLAVFFIILIFCIITILPWTLRNYSVYGVFIPLDTESSGIILGGFLKSKTEIDPRIPIPTVVEEKNPGEGYIEETGMLRKYILTHPFEILSNIPRNIRTFLEPDEEIFRRLMSNDLIKFRISREIGYLYAIASWLFYAVVLFSAIYGLLWAPRNSLKDLLLIFLVFFTSLHIICSAVGRHHTPIMTFLFIFSAWFFCNIKDFKMFFKKRWFSSAFASLLFLFFSLLWIFQLINIKL
ncbi:hypothetical protein KKB18_13585, partial [bacterium]|nr:hypothetical protein [bacterium]